MGQQVVRDEGLYLLHSTEVEEGRPGQQRLRA